jgi:hypothetical protein
MKTALKPTPKPTTTAAAVVKPVAASTVAPAAKGSALSNGSSMPLKVTSPVVAPKKVTSVTSKVSSVTSIKAASSTETATLVLAAAEAAALAAAVAAAAVATASAAAAAAAAERALVNGQITIKYADYEPLLTIVDGCITADAIDEELALTFVYPNCEIQLTQLKVIGIDWRTVDWNKLETRSKDGIFSGLIKDTVYWVAIIEDGVEKKRYEKEQAQRASAFNKNTSAGGGHTLIKEDRQLTGLLEKCSCLEGTPCATPECCLDYTGRYENARRCLIEARGVKGAQAHTDKGF